MDADATHFFDPRNTQMTRLMTRRGLTTSALQLALCLPVANLLLSSVAMAELPALDPSDPKAKPLGYVLKSTKPGSQCGNCQQFQGKAGDASGACTIFPGKSVVATGYCLSWVKKAA
jgi:hypothetical protein